MGKSPDQSTTSPKKKDDLDKVEAEISELRKKLWRLEDRRSRLMRDKPGIVWTHKRDPSDIPPMFSVRYPEQPLLKHLRDW